MDDTTLLVVIAGAAGLIALYGMLRSTKAKLSQVQAGLLEAESQIESRARALASAWQESEVALLRDQQRDAAVREAQSQLEDWKRSEEKRIRQDAASRSQSVTTGKVAEQFIPYLPDFTYHPSDARFLGSPVDFIVFDGLSEGALKEIVLVEVKTGGSTLTQRERQIRDVVQSGRVGWREIRLAGVSEGPPKLPPHLDVGICIITAAAPEGWSLVDAVVRWRVKPDDYVELDEILCELETHDAVFQIPSPGAGQISPSVEEGATVSKGDFLANLLTPR